MATTAPLVPYGNSENYRQDVVPVTKGFSEHASRYVGAELSTTQPNYLDRINYHARDYPAFFRNRKLQLQDTIEGFFLFGFEWYVYILPWLVTSEKHIKKNIYRHNVRPALPTPNKGVSRHDSHQTSTKEAHVERKGRDFYMEGDAFGSDEGDRQYILNCMGVAQGAQLAVNMATMQELIDCKNYVRDWTEYAGRRNFLEEVMEMEIARFAGMAGSGNYLEQVVQASKTAFQNRSLKAGAIIGWDTLPMLQSMVLTGSKTAFWQLGPDGNDVFVQGPDAITTIKDLPLFINRQFTLNEDTGPTQYLARDTTFGEKYEMEWNSRRNEFFGPGGSLYHSDQREIRIYDMDTDAFKPVSIKDALLNSKIWYTNPGYYTKELEEAVRDANFDARKQNGFAKKFERYSNPQQLDGELEFTRTENMFFSHDVNARLMFLPTYIAQFDTDVVKTNDLIQMAYQYLQNAFGSKYADFQTRVASARDFVNRWETEANDNDEFWDALAALNAPKSTDDNGKWVGERAKEGAPRDWVGNSNASLDLPESRAGFGLYPPGFANYPGFKEFVAKGAARRWDLQTVEDARKVVALVEEITQTNGRMAPTSRISQLAATPEWFHSKKLELATWEILFGFRAPIFLAAPGGVKGNAKEDKSIWQGEEPEVPKYNFYPGQYAIIGTLPVGALIAEMIKVALGQAQSDEAVRIFNSIVPPEEVGWTDEQKKAAELLEQQRSNTLNALINHIMAFKNEAKKYQLYYAVVNVFNLLKPAADSNLSQEQHFIALAKAVKLNRTQVDQKARENDAKYAAEKDAAKVDINDKSAKLYRLGVADVEIVDFAREANMEIGRKRSELNKVFLGTKTRTDTPMTVLRQAIESVEKLGRRYGQFSWENLEEWSAKVSTRVSGKDIQELASTIENYNVATKSFNDAWTKVFATGPENVDDDNDKDEPEEGRSGPRSKKRLGEEEEDLPPKQLGKEVESNRFFFRAPLSMTRHLLYQASDNADPRIRAADPSTGFRTLFYTKRTPQQRHYEEDPIMTMGRMSFMHDIGMKELHSLETASVLLQHVSLPAVESEESRYVAPDHIVKENRKLYSGSKYSKVSQKRKQQAVGGVDKKRGVSYADRPVAKTAFEQAQEEAHAAMIHSAEVRGRDVAALQGRGRFDDDEDHDDKVGRALPTGPLMYGGDRGFYVADDDDGSMKEDEVSRKQREEISYAVDALQQSAVGTQDYATMMLGTMAYRWERAGEQEDLVRMAMLIIMMMEARDINTFVNLIDHNINLPFNFMLWRLNITVSMYSAIVLVPGRETGVNIIGDRNFSVQEFNVDKIVHAHLTFYHRSIVWRDQNIDHLLDLYPQKVRAGWGMSWVKKPEEINQMQKKRGSLVAWIYPLGEEVNKVALSFVGGSIYRAAPLTNLQDASLAASLSMTPFYADRVWKINRARTSYTRQIATFARSREQLNVVAFSGPMYAYDKAKKTWTLKTAGTGHAQGNKAGPGRRKIWMGQSWETFQTTVAAVISN
jgi:hypothetical protein